MKRALISGASGQDGTHLSAYLTSLGYDVWIGSRHYNPEAKGNYIYLDPLKHETIQVAIRRADPDEIYNLAGQSFVPPSWIRPEMTFDVNVGGLARILEFVEQYNKDIRIYQASSSEMFGNVDGVSDERTPMEPTSPYGVSKLAAHKLCQVYRGKGLFVVGGICFNHEGEHRQPEMVTRKITRAVARWYLGDTSPLLLGSLDAKRDWGYAGDYVRAMWSMLQMKEPEDYVISTGEPHSVQEFLDVACEVACVKPNVIFNPRFARTGEIREHIGDSTKARKAFGFVPKVGFGHLVEIMVQEDIRRLKEAKNHV